MKEIGDLVDQETSAEKMEEKNSSLDHNSYFQKVDGIWECKVCLRSSMRKQVMSDHVELHMPTSLVERECPVCGKTLRYTNTFKRHMNEVHSNAIDRVCNACGRSYRKGQNFNRHQKKCNKFRTLT